MQLAQFKALEKQLGDFVEQFGDLFGRSERRYWCKQYLTGLLLDGERKSVEPLAGRVAGGDVQAMQQFVNQSPWAHEALQLSLARSMLRRCRTTRGAVLVLDDTTLPKQGRSSVGVARQYCGAVGKVANCQSVVTWHYADAQTHFPLLGQLYLPRVWTTDVERMRRAGIPEECQSFREKWKIEQGYQQLKEELGLDHFEGRSWRGLHHHLTLCFMAYCFLLTAKKGKKKSVDVTTNQTLAESSPESDTMPGVSKLSPRAEGRVVRLNLSYLT